MASSRESATKFPEHNTQEKAHMHCKNHDSKQTSIGKKYNYTYTYSKIDLIFRLDPFTFFLKPCLNQPKPKKQNTHFPQVLRFVIRWSESLSFSDLDVS